MRTFTLVFICFLAAVKSFSINQNPKNWEHGYLFEKQNYNGTTYLYIDPIGQFIWIDDSPSSRVRTIDGVWKRNPINKSLNFYSEEIENTRYLRNSLTINDNGLYNLDQKAAVFKIASECATTLLLPQILEQANIPSYSRDIFSLYEIKKREKNYSWEIPNTLESDVDKVLEELKKNNKSAQNWSNKKYQQELVNRSKWSTLYPEAWNFSKTTFSSIQSDSAKVRAMCMWFEKNIKYDKEFSREYNKDNNPEITFNQKKGLCQDYSLLLNVFCESQNIPCFNIAGYPVDDIDGRMSPSTDSYHAWNYVKINGEWLAVDPTWYQNIVPQNHFLIPLGAYQYQHLPDNNVTLANSFAPKNTKEQKRCPVVMQNNMDIIYVGSREYVTEVVGKVLEFDLYSNKETTLDLHIDSLPHGYLLMSFSFCMGCYYDLPSMYEYFKGKKHNQIKLVKGINHIRIPLVSDIAEYTLRNNNFEIAFVAYPKSATNRAFDLLTYSPNKLSFTAQAYSAMGKWVAGETIDFQIPENLKNHPNWELIKSDFQNRELEYHYEKSNNTKYAIFEISRYKVGGQFPVIKIEIDGEKNVIGSPMIAFE
jgi:hypothetical protein